MIYWLQNGSTRIIRSDLFFINMNKETKIEPIFIRFKELYITLYGDTASVTDSPLKTAKKQFVKVDGQGRKYLTYHKKKIILDI